MKNSRYFEIRSYDLNIHLENIKKNIEQLEEFIQEFLLQKGFYKNIKNFLFNDAFGSLLHLKIELQSRYKCEEYKINIDNIQLDW